MRKTFSIIILFVIAVLCAFWSPWTSWQLSITSLLGIAPPAETTGLQVTSLAGDLEVYIDGILQGKVGVNDSPITIPGVQPGEHQVRLKRLSAVEGAYYELNRLIKFEPGVDVVIAYELGPSAEFSGGHIIYAIKSTELTTGVKLNLDVNVEEADVLIDDRELGKSPIVGQILSGDRAHLLKVEKRGYDGQEFKLLPESQEERDKILGYTLYVKVDLFLQPIPVF